MDDSGNVEIYTHSISFFSPMNVMSPHALAERGYISQRDFRNSVEHGIIDPLTLQLPRRYLHGVRFQ